MKDKCAYCGREVTPCRGCADIVKALYKEHGPDLSCPELKELVMDKLNNWSCLPAAFAYCMGLTLKDLVELIGHDGSEIVWPDAPSPLDRRGFHMQEITNALQKMCYSAMPVGRGPTLTNGHGPAIDVEDEFFEYAKTLLGVHLGVSDTGINHAVAYIPFKGFWCPNQGAIASFNTKEIWLVNKCSEDT